VKGTTSTRTARSHHGRSKAPMSRTKKQKTRRQNAAAYGTLGALIGLPFGPIGVGIGTFLGAKIGHDTDPE
jgi:hypothetical protein